MVTSVTPAGTMKFCAAPVELNVIDPPHRPDEQEHVAPIGQVVVQSAQTTLTPQTLSDVPSTHVPPMDAEQQPPLHA
jgi:hypothetical protein